MTFKFKKGDIVQDSTKRLWLITGIGLGYYDLLYYTDNKNWYVSSDSSMVIDACCKLTGSFYKDKELLEILYDIDFEGINGL